MTHTAGYPQRDEWRTGPPPQPARRPAGAAPLPRDTRRRQARFAAGALQVQSPVFGAVVEISVGGLRLESATPVVPGGRYVFRLSHGSRFLEERGRVVWCRPRRIEFTAQGRRTIYQAGVELRRREPGRQWRAALAARAGVAVGV